MSEQDPIQAIFEYFKILGYLYMFHRRSTATYFFIILKIIADFSANFKRFVEGSKKDRICSNNTDKTDIWCYFTFLL